MKFFGRSIEQNADRSAMGYESPLKNAGAGSVPDNGETIVFIFTGDDIEFTATAESITVD
ncbi:MAG: hypothetical protein LBH72_07525 [Proteiniphilum sp.]|jgi:hypothetical protein|nr:hypothetical protein [Proteiniphilum sp.]